MAEAGFESRTPVRSRESDVIHKQSVFYFSLFLRIFPFTFVITDHFTVNFNGCFLLAGINFYIHVPWSVKIDVDIILLSFWRCIYANVFAAFLH